MFNFLQVFHCDTVLCICSYSFVKYKQIRDRVVWRLTLVATESNLNTLQFEIFCWTLNHRIISYLYWMSKVFALLVIKARKQNKNCTKQIVFLYTESVSHFVSETQVKWKFSQISKYSRPRYYLLLLQTEILIKIDTQLVTCVIMNS